MSINKQWMINQSIRCSRAYSTIFHRQPAKSRSRYRTLVYTSPHHCVCRRFDVGNQSPPKPLPANFEGTSRCAVGVEIPRDDRAFLWFVSFPLMDRHWRGRYIPRRIEIVEDFEVRFLPLHKSDSRNIDRLVSLMFSRSDWLHRERTVCICITYTEGKKLTEYGIFNWLQ